MDLFDVIPPGDAVKDKLNDDGGAALDKTVEELRVANENNM
jgi:hypothetical protein